MIDISNPLVRNKIIQEILGNENVERKKESLKRSEVYNSRQKDWIEEKLLCEFDAKTVARMRKVMSINLTERITNEMASLYSNKPSRVWVAASEQEAESLDKLYASMRADVNFKSLNRKFKLQDQATMMIVPKRGKLWLRVLQPHQFDVVPNPDNPEEPEVYVMSVMDKTEFLNITGQDLINQHIGDIDDDKKARMRFVFWSKEWNVLSDGHGNELSDDEGPTLTPNPIGRLPFVDAVEDREFEYWVRHGSSVVEFALDLGVLLSDQANIIRLQGYSQAVVAAEELPDNFVVGPNHLLFLKIKPGSDIQPSFKFETPSPDLQGSKEYIEMVLRMFLTSKGLDPNIVAVESGGNRFSSGVERLLAMIEKFEASKDDVDKFQVVERHMFNLIRDWNNALQGTDALLDEFKVGSISDNVKLDISFAGPENIQSTDGKVNTAVRQMEAGLMSRSEAIAHIRDVDQDTASGIADKIDKEDGIGVVSNGNGKEESL